MATPGPATFTLNVDGVGTFTFHRRTMREEMRIAAEHSRITEGVDKPTPYLELVSTWMATLKVLTAKPPEGWDIDNMDPLDGDTYVRLQSVFSALRAKEGSFRGQPASGGQAAGPADVQDAGVRVPPAVQPGADGSPIP